jgi:hypothetical protein
VSYTAGDLPAWAQAADFNNDGKPDLVDVSEYTGFAVLINRIR